MIAGLSNHLWQSTLFALAAGLLTIAFRNNRAQVRYWLWLSASIKFLIPFSLLMSLGSHVQRTPAPHLVVVEPVSVTMMQISEPFAVAPPHVPSKPRSRDWTPLAILAAWALGFAAIAMVRLRGWLRIRDAVRTSIPIDIPATVEVRSSPSLLEPGVVGLLQPILLLPAGILERLTPSQLEAVLAHELCHARRHDNLFASLHMIVEAVFWFHPLVWWIGGKLVEERERACDEEVLQLGSEPQAYAEAILNVCKLYVESPLACVSGVTGADLKKRIEAIMTNRIGERLNVAKKWALAAAAMITITLPVVIGITNAPALRAQAQAVARPQFEVASIRMCDQPSSGRSVSAKGGRGGPGSAGNSPGRLSMPCLPLRLYIQTAYIDFASGHIDRQSNVRVETGTGPAWIYNDRYAITAKAEDDNASQEMMQGPMLQALLEDRFKLKIRRETRDTPLYALTVAKGGPKLQPTPPESCTIRDLTKFPMPQLEPGQPPFCGRGGIMMRDGRAALDMQGATMAELAQRLNLSGRPVIDRTGIAGRFDIKFDFAPDPAAVGPRPVGAPDPPPIDETAPSIFTAVAGVGLKLEPIKGPRDFLVVDHVERPTEN